MILILISWIILVFFFIPSGMFLKSILKIENPNFSIGIFLGIFAQCVVLSVLCFFIRIGIEVFLCNLTIIIFLLYWQRKSIKRNLNEAKHNFDSLHKISKILLFGILFFALQKCAQSPFLIDNESYYIQTIRWVNEYGFVKGLANLHIFLGQTSPLHILQAGFNFNFLTDRINDLNGFILIIGAFFFITEFEKNYTENKEIHWIGLILVFNVLFFQFIGEPSPDLSILVISQIIFYFFLEETQVKGNFHSDEIKKWDSDNLRLTTAFSEEKKTNDNFKITALLFLLLVFIKITIAPLSILFFYWIIKEKKGTVFFISSGAIIGSILILKNCLITGYPFYPFDFFSISADWKIPKNLLQFISESTKNAGYFENTFVKNPTFYEKISSWLHLGGINRIFNLGVLALFVLALFTKKNQTQKNYKVLYFILGFHFLLLLFTSPQFRFFLPEFIFFSVLILSSLCERLRINVKTIRYSLISASLLPIVFIEFIDFKNLTDNKLHHQKANFSWKQILIPEKNSKFSEETFEKIKNENLEYYSPKENFFFFGTANGDLPCVNKIQIDYFEKYYLIKPQMRSSALKDGFYSKKIDLKQ
jgi:hypothetical protein